MNISNSLPHEKELKIEMYTLTITSVIIQTKYLFKKIIGDWINNSG